MPVAYSQRSHLQTAGIKSNYIFSLISIKLKQEVYIACTNNIFDLDQFPVIRATYCLQTYLVNLLLNLSINIIFELILVVLLARHRCFLRHWRFSLHTTTCFTFLQLEIISTTISTVCTMHKEITDTNK